jgi:hypothetical protein
MKLVFLIGSPRSGTTILGEVLGLHPDIAYWYEPTFVFDRFFRDAAHDRRTAQEATPSVAAYIQDEFEYFYRKHGQRVIVEKSPLHSLKVPFLKAIFPDAQFLHLVRHGGDTTLSIHREWQTRAAVGRHLISFPAFNRLRKHVLYQRLLRHRIAALRFQLGGYPLFSTTHVYRSRWNGRFGWGPRFEGWEQVIDQVSLLEFNAMQWAKCVDTTLDDAPLIDPARFFQVRYEDFITHPEDVLRQITSFAGLPFPSDFMQKLPPIKAGNSGKWKTALSEDEQQKVARVIEPTLKHLGYPL